MPVFVVIVAGLTDFGWLFFHRSAVDAAVQAGCREGALVDPLLGDPEATATAGMVSALRDNGVPCGEGCTTAVTQTGVVPSRSLQCHLSIHFEPLFGLLTGKMPVSATTDARFEWQREPSALPGAGS